MCLFWFARFHLSSVLGFSLPIAQVDLYVRQLMEAQGCYAYVCLPDTTQAASAASRAALRAVAASQAQSKKRV